MTLITAANKVAFTSRIFILLSRINRFSRLGAP